MGVPDACQYKIAGGRYHMVTRKESDSTEVPQKYEKIELQDLLKQLIK